MWKHYKLHITFLWHFYSLVTAKLLIHLWSPHTCVKRFCTGCNHACVTESVVFFSDIRKQLLMWGCPVSLARQDQHMSCPAHWINSSQPGPTCEAKPVETKKQQQQQGRISYITQMFVSITFQTDQNTGKSNFLLILSKLKPPQQSVLQNETTAAIKEILLCLLDLLFSSTTDSPREKQ